MDSVASKECPSLLPTVVFIPVGIHVTLNLPIAVSAAGPKEESSQLPRYTRGYPWYDKVFYMPLSVEMRWEPVHVRLHGSSE